MKTMYLETYILNMNKLIIDLVYGKENRLTNEFVYQYIQLEEEEIIPTLKHIISQIQVI